VKTKPGETETVEVLVKRLAEIARERPGSRDENEVIDQLGRRLREEGRLSEFWIDYLILSLRPGGEKQILPGETREEAVARLMGHYGWDERTAEFTISLSQGIGDAVAVDDEGNVIPWAGPPWNHE